MIFNLSTYTFVPLRVKLQNFNRVIIRAVATFEAAEAVASVVFRTVASVKTITSSSRILHLMTVRIILP